MSSQELAVELTKALAWPAVALVTLIVVRVPLFEFLRGLAGRVNKLSAFNFEIELGATGSASLVRLTLDDTKALSGTEWNESFVLTLLQQLDRPEPVDYAIVDVGDGGEWITSRMYLFCVLLKRMKGLRCVVFVARTESAAEQLVGWTEPSRVCERLARSEPWLDAAYGRALGATYPEDPNSVVVPAVTNANAALNLANEFVRLLQRPNPGPGLVALGPATHEHAQWVTAEKLRRLLGTDLNDNAITEDIDDPAGQLIKVLRRRGAFVAIKSQRGELRSVIDRNVVLDLAGDHYIHTTSPSC